MLVTDARNQTRMTRHEFSTTTKRILRQRAGQRCSNPDCRRPTCGPGDRPDQAVSIGEAAHLTAAEEDGPRYDPALTREQRCSIHNAVWLCCNCHTLVDHAADRFPADLLRSWKQQAEFEALAALLKYPAGPVPTRDLPPTPETVEAVLERYCDDCLAQWEDACADPQNPDKLGHYVEPHYALLREDARPQEASQRAPHPPGGPGAEAAEPYQNVAQEGDDAETELTRLLQAGRRLCLTEDAGSGKSIFTRRLRAFLSSPAGRQALCDGRPPLAVRWEPRVRGWPAAFDEPGLTAALAESLQPSLDALDSAPTPAKSPGRHSAPAAWS